MHKKEPLIGLYNVSIVLKVTYVLADIHGDNAAFDDIL